MIYGLLCTAPSEQRILFNLYIYIFSGNIYRVFHKSSIGMHWISSSLAMEYLRYPTGVQAVIK